MSLTTSKQARPANIKDLKITIYFSENSELLNFSVDYLLLLVLVALFCRRSYVGAHLPCVHLSAFICPALIGRCSYILRSCGVCALLSALLCRSPFVLRSFDGSLKIHNHKIHYQYSKQHFKILTEIFITQETTILRHSLNKRKTMQ